MNTKIDAMLKANPDNLTPHDLPSEATWADKYRNSNNRRDHSQQTQNWHFVDLEINDSDLKAACFGFSGAVSKIGERVLHGGSIDGIGIKGSEPLHTFNSS